MEWDLLVMGIAIALMLLVPCAVKWRIGLKVAIPWALLVGGASGTLWSWHWLGLEHGSPVVVAPLQALTIAVSTAGVAMLMFYRDPGRAAPQGSGIIVSPADGAVAYVKRVEEGIVPHSEKGGGRFRLEELCGTQLSRGGHLIGISMNLLNVHVNRAPISGQVRTLKRIGGGFGSLARAGAILQNERFTTVLGDGDLEVAVVQIASRLVRRIQTYLKPGQRVEVGQRIGMIKFGSQVDLVVPNLRGLRVVVEPGDTVVAGETIVVRHDEARVSTGARDKAAPAAARTTGD